MDFIRPVKKPKPLFIGPCRTMGGYSERDPAKIWTCADWGSMCKCLENMPAGPEPPVPEVPPAAAGQWDKTMLTEIDMVLWKEHVDRLAAMNRFSGFYDIIAARDFIKDFLAALPGTEVTIQEFPLDKPSKFPQFTQEVAYNVICTIKGTEYPDSVIVIGGHYDAIAYDGFVAPGAVDNASGASAVIELARLFSMHPPKNTMEFVLFSAEELGFKGSIAHLLYHEPNIKFMLNIDMIGWGGRPEGNVIDLETAREFNAYAQIWAQVASEVCDLPYKISLRAWGSDHITYLGASITALMTTNADCVRYEHYHSTNDLPEEVDIGIATNFLRMNSVALSFLANLDLSTGLPKRLLQHTRENTKESVTISLICQEPAEMLNIIKNQIPEWGLTGVVYEPPKLEDFMYGTKRLFLSFCYFGVLDDETCLMNLEELLGEDASDISLFKYNKTENSKEICGRHFYEMSTKRCRP